MPRTNNATSERYDFSASPFSQNLTQNEFAALLGVKKTQLEALIDHKDLFIVRREQKIGKKIRKLAYPVGKLRTVHERLKYHLNKIKQPVYLFSPRKGRAQRDNAVAHLDRNHFLSVDVKQFYPSTSNEHIYRWAHYAAGLRDDVAGLLVHLATVDGRLSFGSPLSPVLASLVHRSMFDTIYALCRGRGLRMSLWVDDLTISGLYIPGVLVSEIREVIRLNGFQSHKIKFRTGARPVVVTGVPIDGERIAAPRSMHHRIEVGYTSFGEAQDDWARGSSIQDLLSNLGSYRYMVGPRSPAGRRAADRMNALRQRHKKLSMSKAVN